MTDDRRERRASEISPSSLALASFGSLAATFLLGRLGFAGTLVGAALTPILIVLAQELVRRPVRRVRETTIAVVETPVALPRPRRFSVRSQLAWLARLVSWRSVLVTGALAFAIVVAVFTVADIAAGDSVVADRPSTFFPTRAGKPKQPAETGTTEPSETSTRESKTERVETEQEPAETATGTTRATTSTTGETATEPPPPATGTTP
ncbi:MAG: hypothetical protein M3312_11135 [Actinomycetota bacterium]|nr:hypothetical protein [Actinomycetota bacterium]